MKESTQVSRENFVRQLLQGLVTSEIIYMQDRDLRDWMAEDIFQAALFLFSRDISPSLRELFRERVRGEKGLLCTFPDNRRLALVSNRMGEDMGEVIERVTEGTGQVFRAGIGCARSGINGAGLSAEEALTALHTAGEQEVVHYISLEDAALEDTRLRARRDLRTVCQYIRTGHTKEAVGLIRQELERHSSILELNLCRESAVEIVSALIELLREKNLEEKIYQIEQTRNYDDRQVQLENNVYVLTAMIQEYMYNYLYCESVQLNLLQQQISRQIAAEILLVLVLSGGLILLLVRYSVRLSRSVTQPVVDLSRRAEDVIGGDLTVREPVRSETYELRTLGEGMEQMIARLNAQIQEITQKQASLRKAELALLQAQVNPHFLYNAMDTIIWLIEASRPQAAVEMVSNLSSFFRHSLSRGEDVITLGEEEEHVRSYLQIQQARYKDILEYTIQIDAALRETRLPKLTLQPLVENALYHGIKLKRGKGCIYITSRKEGADVLLQITDDGAGMAAARLEELNRAIENGERVGFGLVTVHERLRLLFGPPYGLALSSREGVGTTVTVRVPCQGREDREP